MRLSPKQREALKEIRETMGSRPFWWVMNFGRACTLIPKGMGQLEATKAGQALVVSDQVFGNLVSKGAIACTMDEAKRKATYQVAS